MFKNLATLLVFATLLYSCSNTNTDSDKKTIYVTIAPLSAIVEEITGGDYNVETLVPKGASPESFEPTANDLIALNNADA